MLRSLLAALLALAPLAASAEKHAHEHHATGQEQRTYACPMHPEVRSHAPGRCPICGMQMREVEVDEHEHEHHATSAMEAVGAEDLRLPHGREGSGTSWMPDTSPIFAHHAVAGDWMLMLHYSVLAGYDDQWSDRGSRRFTSINWLMGMASHPLLGGELELRSMFSLEPATAGGPDQIPLLLQTGETYGGTPLHDRQHPHDFFMELAAIYRHALAGGFGFELYAAPSGEPALGPTAFMHRVSAMLNPFPPIGHHWQDSTHIAYPVLTAGLYDRWLKLEGSVFHGREPDEDRWNLDLGALDSWSARLSANLTANTSVQVSYGYLHSPETLRPDESEHRLTGSFQFSAPVFDGGNLALTAVYGRNVGHVSSNSLLGEAQLDLDGHNVPFLRLEWVEKPADELVIAADEHTVFDVGLAVIGYAHRFSPIASIAPLVGAAIDVGRVPGDLQGAYGTIPGDLQGAYGTQFPLGAFVFVGIQPARLSLHGH